MKYLKKYNEDILIGDAYPINDGGMSIEDLCRKYRINNYKINSDGSVDVDGNVNFEWPPTREKKGVNKIPIKFNRINGSFYCNNNLLETLENSPVYVSVDFMCGINNLKTLIGGPKFVGRHYDCRGNYLKDMYGFVENQISGKLITAGNRVYEIIKLVPEEYQGKFALLLNEYHVIRDYGVVYERLIEAIADCNIKFDSYKII